MLHFIFFSSKENEAKERQAYSRYFCLQQNHRETSKFLTGIQKFLTKFLCYTANKPKPKTK